MYEDKNVMLEESNKGISASVLKWIAIITMFIDHFAAGFIEPVIYNSGKIPEDLIGQYTTVVDIMRSIGRLAFPIFVFLLVESFFLTSNRKKMSIRLFIFALISEVVFDLCFQNKVLEFTHQNIYFTLLLGFLAMWMSESLKNDKELGKSILKVAIFFGFMIIADLLRTDYGSMGVFAIGVFYLFRGGSRVRRVIATVIGFSFYINGSLFIPAYISAIPLYFYNGKRGRQNKYFFYLFYPVHLLIIYLLRGMFFGFNLF